MLTSCHHFYRSAFQKRLLHRVYICHVLLVLTAFCSATHCDVAALLCCCVMDETLSALCTDPVWDPERDHVWRPVFLGVSSTLAAPENMCSKNLR